MKKWYIVIILTLITLSVSAQDSKDVKPDRKFVNMFYDAEAYMYELNYDMALGILIDLITEYPDNANLQYKIGICYLNSRLSQNKAEEFLEKAALEGNINENYKADNHREVKAPLEAYLYLGQAYRYNYKFDEARETFNTLLDLLDEKDKDNKDLITQLNRELEVTENAVYFTNNPVDAEVRNLGPSINTEFCDHSPVIDMNEDYLVFTSKRPKDNEEMLNQDEDIFISRNRNFVWKKAERLSENINSEKNEASIGLSANAGTMFIFRSEGPNYGNVMISHSGKNLETWADPELLTADINSNHRETHACLTADGNTLYFVSNRLGDDAVGGRDIYVMHLLPNNTWSRPKCLPNTINTIYNEETPFLHPDGVTIFFSSEGHKSMGGYDVFYSKIKEDGTFSDPKNLGYPINTTGDDVSYVLNLDGRRGYLASAKVGGLGDLDIYEILQSGIYINEMVVYTGLVSDINNDIPEDMLIRVINKKTEKVQGIYRAGGDNGNYYIILRPGEEYVIEYDAAGHLMSSANVSPQKEDVQSFGEKYIPINLDPIALLAYKYQDTVYFDSDTDVMLGNSHKNLDDVIKEYENSEDLIVNINYIPGRETEVLTKQRSDKIVDYLVTNGINERVIYFNGDFPAGYQDIYAVEMSDVKELIAAKNDPNLPIDNNTSVSVATGDTVYVDPVFFAFDKSDIRTTHFENLNFLSQYMVDNPRAQVQIAGHTDWYGSNEYNYLLSYRRSKSVKDYLVAKGASPENLITKKYGESDPIASNANNDGSDNPVGRGYNRRVQFTVLIQGSQVYLVTRGIDVENNSVNSTNSQNTTDNNNTNVSLTGKYTVQIMALRKEKSVDFFADLIGVKLSIGADGWYRYYVGTFNTRAEARASMSQLRTMGYDPFVRKLSYY